MGFDVKQMLDGMAQLLAPLGAWWADNYPVLLVFAALGLSYYVTRPFWRRVWRILEETVFANWRLALLGATGLVLSLASGWTTWDGMRNFTNEPLLSFMITFGIQGVMLIVAWLIGESFATGMNARSNRGSGPGLEAQIAAFVMGLAIVAGLIALVMHGSLPITTEQLMFAGVAVAIVVLIGVLQSDLIQPYVQSSRIIIRNSVLWVMFLSCMATSVFFSFDSLFSQIFPAEERTRAAGLRAQNQVAGIIADIGGTIARRQQGEAEALFQSEGWKEYEEQLSLLASSSQGAQPAIEAYFVQQMEDRRRAINEQEQRKASAMSQQAGLRTRSQQLNEELSQLQAERPALVTKVIEQQQVVADVERRLDEQRARVLAEEKGVEGSGKVGRGQMWRAEKAAEERLRAELAVANERLKAPQSRVQDIDRRISSIKAELSQIEGQIAQLAGEAMTAERRIEASQASAGAEEQTLKVDPSRVLPAFERAQVAFRQQPTLDRLSDLQAQCAQLLTAMMSTPATKDQVRAVDCDPKRASEAAAVLFALNTGASAFALNCAGGSNLARHAASADDLFGFARKCLADSGLPSQATDELRTKINFAELNRDDRAHRFVVTWNAFQDGNRLAYLALAIAIAIDLLVFMSGLFGANAVRSPLQDVPSMRPRSAQQLESIIENALLPSPYENAHAVIDAMQPITPVDGFTQEVLLPDTETASRASVRKVLNAAATIGAVAQDPMNPSRFLVRPELFEFLSIVAKKQYESDSESRRLAELKKLVTVALQPYVGDHAAIVLQNLNPMNERGGYSSEVMLNLVPELEQAIVKRTLNAAAVLNFVEQDTRKGEEDRFYVHKELYKTLAMISAANPRTFTWDREARRALFYKQNGYLPTIDAANGGDLTPPPGAVDYESRTQITHIRKEVARDASLDDYDEGEDDDEAIGYGGSGEDREPQSHERPLSPAEQARYRELYEASLLHALGLRDYEDVHPRLNNQEVVDAARSAWKVLKRHCNENSRLNRLVAGYLDPRSNLLSEEYSAQRSKIAGDQRRLDILDEVEQKIHGSLDILILFPEVGLISYLIRELERAAAADAEQSPNEVRLLERLREVDQLIKTTDLADADSWMDIRETLSGWDAGEKRYPQRRDGSHNA